MKKKNSLIAGEEIKEGDLIYEEGGGGGFYKVLPNEQILKRAIEKAVEGGWNPVPHPREILDIDTLDPDRFFVKFWDKETDTFTFFTHKIIFSHPFAKSFFGEEPECTVCLANEWYMGDPHEGKECGLFKVYPWRFHLQQMVVSEDVFKYLEKFL